MNETNSYQEVRSSILENVHNSKQINKLVYTHQLKRKPLAATKWISIFENQDLGWKALNKDYKDHKKRKGLSTNILVSSSAYFQAITSFTKGKRVNVGVKKAARDKEGNEIANIAAIHEFGSSKRNIPARPLWQPTLEETTKWLAKNGFDKIIIKKLNRLK